MCNQIYVLFTFLLCYYLGVGVGEVVCLPVFSFSFFLQDLKSTTTTTTPHPPLSLPFFFYHPVSKGCSFLPFVLDSLPPGLSDCSLDSRPLLSLFLVVSTAALPGLLQSFLLQVDTLSGDGFNSALGCNLISFFSHRYCFPRARAQSAAYSSVDIRY